MKRDAIPLALNLGPIFLGSIAATLCAVGLFLFPLGEERHPTRRGPQRSDSGKAVTLKNEKNERLARSFVVSILVSIAVLAWTGSATIAAPFTVMSFVASWTYIRNKARRHDQAMLQVWPEVTDHLISAIHSGLSLTEALVGLGERGPELVRPHFLAFHQELLSSGDFIGCAQRLKARLNTHGSDQILESIMMAKSLGGSELLQIFRTLGDFLRQDLALRREIQIKHGWIKNSAHLSASAPWILLLLLSTQPGTAAAFAQPGGIAILLVGLVLTGLAYVWMGKLGQLPEPVRVFR